MTRARTCARAGARLLLIAFLLASATWCTPIAAHAHTNLKSARPAPNSSTDGAPPEVQLRFGQPTMPDRRNHVSVIVPSGRDIAHGAAVAGAFGVSQALLSSPEQGWYRVRYSVVFVDGHAGSGAFRFRVTTFDQSASRAPAWLRLAVGGATLYFSVALIRHLRQVRALPAPAEGWEPRWPLSRRGRSR